MQFAMRSLLLCLRNFVIHKNYRLSYFLSNRLIIIVKIPSTHIAAIPIPPAALASLSFKPVSHESILPNASYNNDKPHTASMRMIVVNASLRMDKKGDRSEEHV